MAARSFPEAAAWQLSPAGNPRRRRWAVPRPEDDSDEEPAVLVLSHFSRPPYLSFGSLRVGSSRTRLLGIDNPNAERVEVLVDRFPASATGFSLERRRFSVEVRGCGGHAGVSRRARVRLQAEGAGLLFTGASGRREVLLRVVDSCCPGKSFFSHSS